MIKRPMCVVCIVVVFLIYMGVLISGVPYIDTSSYKGQSVTLVGQVADKATKGDLRIIYLSDISFEDSLELSVSNNSLFSKNLKIGAICYIDGDLPSIGSHVKVQGQMGAFERATNPGEFDLRQYYGIAGYYFPVYKARVMAVSDTSSGYVEWLYRLRERLASVYDDVLPAEDSQVIKAMLLGDKGNLDNEIKELYRENGIAHLLAISGLHVSLIGMCVYKLLETFRLPRIVAVGMAVFIMINYGIMTGLSGSLLRALILFVMLLFSKVLRRSYDICTALATAALVIVIINPYMLMYSGLWMSFMAVIGIGIFSRCIQPSRQLKNKFMDGIVRGLLASVAVNFFTLPLMLKYYYSYPPYSVIINLLLVPLMTVLLVAALILGLLGLMGIKLYIIPVFVCHHILGFYKIVCRSFVSLPFSQLVLGKPSIIRSILFYIGIMVMYLRDKQLKRREYARAKRLIYETSMHVKCIKKYGEDYRGRAQMEETLDRLSKPVRQLAWYKKLVIMCTLVLLMVPVRLGVRLQILDVGQGDGICIMSDGRTYMIDGGSSTNDKLAEYILLPYLKSNGIAHIDCWFVSHPDRDHISGLVDILSAGDMGGLTIECICLPDAMGISEDAREIIELAAARGVDIRLVGQGDELSDGKIDITCLNPMEGHSYEDANDYSMVLLIEYNGTGGLLTGDASIASENIYLEYARQRGIELQGVDILKCGHHGSRTATGEALIDTIKPTCALISSGRGNSYGHPHAEVVDRLSNNHISICNTQKMGAIQIVLKNNYFEVVPFLDAY